MIPARGVRRALAVVLVCAGGIAIAVWGTWPVAGRLSTHVIDGSRLGGPFPATIQADVYLTLWILGWDAHALTTAPASLFDGNIFHPASGSLALSEHMLGALPIYLPLALLSGDPVLAHQGTLVLTFAAAFLAMAALVRDWTASWTAAIVAGTLFAFSTFRIANLDNLQTLGNYYLPLIPLCARRSVTDSARRWPVCSALVLTLQALHSYYLGYAGFLTAAVLGGMVLIGCASARRQWRRLVVPVLIAAAAVALSALPYLVARQANALGPPASELVRIGSALPGRTGASAALAIALVTAPFWRAGSVAGVWLVGLALVALASHLMALGPEIEVPGYTVTGPYALAAHLVPGLSTARVPSRFNVAATMALAALAGIGVAGACRRFRSAAAATVLVVLALAVVSAARPLPLRRIETASELPPVYRVLRRVAPGPLVEIPFHDLVRRPFAFEVEAQRMYRSIYHWLPILNGFSGHLPPGYPEVSALAVSLPDLQALSELVRTTGVRYVLVHRAELAPGEWQRWRGHTGLHPIGAFGTDVLFVTR